MDVSVKSGCKTHICRTCLQIISKTCKIFKLDYVYIKRQLQDCVPGLNLDLTPNAVVCESCAAQINGFHKFLTKCYQINDRIDNYRKRMGNVAHVNLKEMMDSSFEGSGFVGNHVRNYVRSPDLRSQELSVMVRSPDSSSILSDDEVVDVSSTVMGEEEDGITSTSTKLEILEQLEKDDVVEPVAVEQTRVESASVKTEIGFLKESFREDALDGDLNINEESKQLDISTIESEVSFDESLDEHFSILEREISGNCSNEPEQNDQEMNYNENQLPSAFTMNANVNTNLEQLEICQLPATNIKVKKCSDMFKYKDSSLNIGAQNENAKASPLPNKNLTPFKCNYCTFTSIFVESYDIHLRMHSGEKPYKCDICNYSSAQRLNLVAHMATHPKKSYQCDKCSYRTEDNDMFNEHVRSHEEEKQRNVMMTTDTCKPSAPEPYLCSHCDYKAANKSILKKHVKNHKEAFKYKCRHCSFLTNGSLAIVRHANTHTKPFFCTLCSYRTSAARWLEMHKIKKHSN